MANPIALLPILRSGGKKPGEGEQERSGDE